MRTSLTKKVLAACLIAWVGLFWTTAEAGSAGLATSPDLKARVNDRDACLECHEKATVKTLEASPHVRLSCLACHPQAAQTPHENQPKVDCQACHRRHGEAQAHDTHLAVTCQACHLKNVIPVREPGTGRILWRAAPGSDNRFDPHVLAAAGREETCRRCHATGNTVSAAAAILPAKSVLCLPCHPATLAVGDTVTLTSLAIFLLGWLWLGSIWLSGDDSPEKHTRDESSSRVNGILTALLSDVLLQKRLWRRSPGRWVIHGLIFFGMLFRFLWGLAALILSKLSPESPWVWVPMDVNAPVTAFLFDLTGVMIIWGVLLAGLRRTRPATAPPVGLPRPDWWALGLLGGTVVLGFVVEGARIAMTGAPPGSGFAFLGALLSQAWAGRPGPTGLYPWLWYVHAGLWGAFVAYIPFSRMIHIILAPVILMVNTAGRR